MSCLSKGLCAPVGSVLAGPADVIEPPPGSSASGWAGPCARPASSPPPASWRCAPWSTAWPRTTPGPAAWPRPWPSAGPTPGCDPDTVRDQHRRLLPPRPRGSPRPPPRRGGPGRDDRPGCRPLRHPPRRRRRRARPGRQGASADGPLTSRAAEPDARPDERLPGRLTPWPPTSRRCSATKPTSLLTHQCKGITADELTLPGPTTSTGSSSTATADPRASATWPRCSTTAASAAPATSRSCPSTRASSTRRRPASPRTPPTSTRPTSSSSRSRAGCNAVATTLGGLGHRRPRATPTGSRSSSSSTTTSSSPTRTSYDQVMFGSVRQAVDLGAVGVGATIYFGSERVRPPDPGGERRRSPRPTSSGCSPSSGATCATPPSRPTRPTTTSSADLTGQANHLGVTIEADIIKQKQPENNGGYNALEVRQDRPARLRAADHRQPDRPHPLAGRQLLRGPHRPDQLRRRVQGRRRPGRGRAHRGHQQARRRHGPHRRPQGLPAADGRGRRAPPRRPGRLPRRLGHRSPEPRPAPLRRRLGDRGRSGSAGHRTARRMPGGRPAQCSHADGRSDDRRDPSRVHGQAAPAEQRAGEPETEHGVHRDTTIRRPSSTGSSSGSPATPATACSSPATASPTSAPLFGNDLATLPDFPAEIRAPAGTLAGSRPSRSTSPTTTSSRPGDAPNVLVAMNPAALKANLGDARRRAARSSSTSTPSTSGPSTRPATLEPARPTAASPASRSTRSR